MLIDVELSAQTQDAIARLHEQVKACDKANREAYAGILKDVLDEEFTKNQYNRVPWRKYGMAPEMSVECLRNIGWVEARIAETDLSLSEKESTAKNRVVITYKDGSSSVEFKSTSLSSVANYKQIDNIRDATPEDITGKKKTYYYHVVD